MKCPKCSFVSHDYLDACCKCSIDLVDFKAQMHLVAIKPGVLDLSMVLDGSPSSVAQDSYGREQDDLFGPQMLVESEEGDDTFDISLDDDFGMTPTQIEELRTMQPGGDEATEILPAAMAPPDVHEFRQHFEPQADERTPDDNTPPAVSDPLGPPKTGYATVMIDLNDMEETIERPGHVVPEPEVIAATASETPSSPDVEIPSLEVEELALPAAAEGSSVGDEIETTAGLDEVDVLTLTAEDAVAFEATAETLDLDEADQVTFAAEEPIAVDAPEAVSDLDEADEMTVIDEMVDFTSADAAASSTDLGDLEVADSFALSDLTEMSLEVQDVEEADMYQATELETALEMPSIDLEAALTAEEPMAPELDDDPVDLQNSLQLPTRADEDDLRLDFDDLDLEDDERSSR